ncbi:MAG: glycosyltransferase family 4 protein [Flavobacteriales bacterium]|nr:glycosyltransferase family 4 protein [Flavobacteriales bacterium]
MSILFFTSFPPPVTGQTNASLRIFQMLSQQHQVSLINTADPNRFKRKGTRPSLSFRLNLLLKFWRLALSLLLNKYDFLYTVYASTPGGLKRDYLLVRIVQLFRKKTKIIAHIHSGDFGQNFTNESQKKQHQFILDHTHKVIFLSESLNHTTRKKDVAYIPNSISDDLYFSEEEIANKLKSKLNKKVFNVVFIGNLIKEKGYMDILEAAFELLKQSDSFSFDFVGAWNDTIIQEQLQAQITSADHQKNIRFHGAVYDLNQLKAFYNNADVLVLPSYYKIEAQPLCVIEALNSATPIITTNHSGLKELNNDGVGLIVNKKSPSEIVSALLTLKNDDQWLEFATSARNAFKKRYSKAQSEKNMLELFAEN